ncbi:DnaT-like ssDNA-binding protein [Rhodospirillum rubrum]|uniref:Putative DnaT-like domain-containing protein n=1 Tax=Rhodospirillum rubrum (strain ATCC 11170 / ATH 1.1.1 / DSM 467 / LMG 4362 / NCIMB 8255 / S1) TaxID=269796 RepID=Q2RR63_RHORT|nr:DnaT-like ssDNA-binding protein [Rhodospirillum rubrum]ABC23382.1 phage-related conserved hypothetical protein [Rhodospirillum rubrum ATCC 11170]AEO49118.1 hypothetical protein F11_13280 [Rhodospirillum rubrum F11]MBK5955028.1 hypothetical protein [Rhodospirillum rubrum]QXG79355.1 hypothetical protein KUL73_13335 [Rhodospirillum rubrum]
MSLIVEDGGGRPDADSFIALIEADAYWAARPHAALATAWAGAEAGDREGALREAAGYVDRVYGARFAGRRLKGRTQGLCWPRREAFDRSGAPIESDRVPREVAMAACELAARALAGPLAPDPPTAGRIAEELVRVDTLTTRTAYAVNSPAPTTPPVVEALLAPLLRDGTARVARG